LGLMVLIPSVNNMREKENGKNLISKKGVKKTKEINFITISSLLPNIGRRQLQSCKTTGPKVPGEESRGKSNNLRPFFCSETVGETWNILFRKPVQV